MTPPRIHTASHWTPWGEVFLAHDDDKGADASPYGRGMTQQEAVEDLMAQLEDEE